MIKTILTSISLGITYGILSLIIGCTTLFYIYVNTYNFYLSLIIYLIVGCSLVMFFSHIYNMYLGATILIFYSLPIFLLLIGDKLSQQKEINKTNII